MRQQTWLKCLICKGSGHRDCPLAVAVVSYSAKLIRCSDLNTRSARTKCKQSAPKWRSACPKPCPVIPNAPPGGRDEGWRTGMSDDEAHARLSPSTKNASPSLQSRISPARLARCAAGTTLRRSTPVPDDATAAIPKRRFFAQDTGPCGPCPARPSPSRRRPARLSAACDARP